MSNLEDFDVYNFLKNRSLTVIDEVGSLNATFGTNMMYLLRRMESSQNMLQGDISVHQYIGASATLPDAQQWGHCAVRLGDYVHLIGGAGGLEGGVLSTQNHRFPVVDP